MKIRRLRYGLPYEPYIHEPELHFFEGELMGEQEPPPAQPRLFESSPHSVVAGMVMRLGNGDALR